MRGGYPKVLATIGLVGGLLGTASALAQSDGVTLQTGAQIAAGVAKTKDGLASIKLPLTADIRATRRERSGTPELHDAIDDVFVGQKGSVAILVGGTLQGAHEVSPGEHRDGKIDGGRLVPFSAGDVLLIPAGVPHQMMVEKGPFEYLAFKLPAAK